MKKLSKKTMAGYPKVFEITYASIADAANIPLEAVYDAIYEGCFLPTDILSVSAFVQHRRAIEHAKIEPLKEFPGTPKQQENWKNRWPLFDIYLCAFPECKTAMLYPGFCKAHGGFFIQPIQFNHTAFYFDIYVGSHYVSLHRLLMGNPPNLVVQHIDNNPWNNRMENLIAIPAQEALALARTFTSQKPKKDIPDEKNIPPLGEESFA